MEPDAETLLEVPISAIEHYSYCPRQCALIHVEQVFEENVFTIRGRLAHERVEQGKETLASGMRVLRDVPLWSERLGLRGKADVIEMRPQGPYPVEYKVGKRHGMHADLQLCAQALCLEEMLETAVTRGAIFYHALRHRHEVVFDRELRRRTAEVTVAIRAMLGHPRLPSARNDARCSNCSLINACMPKVLGEPARLRGLQGALFHRWPVTEVDD
ncbi:MAG TPA: CRISPR-associated protein Cas4 [Candidatus Binataceae bacterium]|nr:CRISPR-associated protein Cas4 [Candidatus Binataceae bacterium]HVB80031.1 CRISPR-associated protein Cas4 [Candidatus Binataceae bacterium]